MSQAQVCGILAFLNNGAFLGEIPLMLFVRTYYVHKINGSFPGIYTCKSFPYLRMASRGPSSRSAYVLMKDVQAVKQSSGFKKMIGLREFSVVNVHRGELLIQIPENERQQCGDGPLLNYRLFKDPNILLYSGEENVSPLGEHDFQLLEAIASTNDRFTVFSHPDKLDWGASLRKGSRVFVKIPNTQIVASAVIRCKGPVEGLPGISFGVEITVSVFNIIACVDQLIFSSISRIHIVAVKEARMVFSEVSSTFNAIQTVVCLFHWRSCQQSRL